MAVQFSELGSLTLLLRVMQAETSFHTVTPRSAVENPRKAKTEVFKLMFLK